MSTLTADPATPPTRPRKYRRPDGRINRANLTRHLLLIGLSAAMFYPLLWMLGASFREDSQVSNPSFWPGEHFTLEGYIEGWEGIAGIPFGRFILNSTLVAVGCVVANVLACSLTAYAFARIDFKGKKIWFAIMLGTLMLPHHVVLIPQYILFREFDWLNTYLPFIIPKLLATDAFFVFLLVQFFRAIPKDIDDAARIDGCGHVRIFLQIILPLAKPALATTAIFSFIYSWNDFFTPLLYLTQTELYTTPLALRAFTDVSTNSAFGALFAMSVISLLPVVGIFIAFQRLFTEGIATSGLKG